MQQVTNHHKSIVKLRPGTPPLEVNYITATNGNGNRKTGMFSVDHCMTYKLGKRSLSFNLTEVGYANRVNVVNLNFFEENGKGSCANLYLRFIRDNTCGVLCNSKTRLSGSFDSFKDNYNVPPLPDTELIGYVCRETGSGSIFTLAKKKSNRERVDKINATHAFLIDDEFTYNLLIKITNDVHAGLKVDLEGPVKLTTDYTNQVMSLTAEKMERQMDEKETFLFKDVVGRLKHTSHGGDDDNDKAIAGNDRLAFNSLVLKAYQDS